jgi:hypothetical protein
MAKLSMEDEADEEEGQGEPQVLTPGGSDMHD